MNCVGCGAEDDIGLCPKCYWERKAVLDADYKERQAKAERIRELAWRKTRAQFLTRLRRLDETCSRDHFEAVIRHVASELGFYVE